MYKLSIVIPVYNAEKFIEQALNSIFKQKPLGVEVIVIDDGSPDKSIELITKCFGKYIDDKSLKLIRTTNSGVSIARNKGVEVATGDYIAFVDADDFVLDNYFENILSVINQYQPDIVEFGCQQYITETEKFIEHVIFSHKNFGLNKISSILKDVYCECVFYPPIRVIKKELVEAYPFPEGVKFCEDLIMFHDLYPNSEMVFNINQSLYAYRVNQSGATLNVKPEYLSDLVDFYLELINKEDKYLVYLKVNLLFIINTLSRRLDKKIIYPEGMNQDVLSLIPKVLFSRDVSFRKKCILLLPNLYASLVSIKKTLEKKVRG